MMTDYIKREDVLGEFTYDDLDEYYTPQIMAIVENIPSADVAPVRHGRWVVIDAEEPRRYGCSECKRLSWNMENYCGNCGARMDGEEKNCDTCKHYDKWWDDIVCDGCTKAYSNWERKDDEID